MLSSCSSAKPRSEKQGEMVGKRQSWKLWRRAFEKGSCSFSGPHSTRNFHEGERIYDVQPVHKQLLQPVKLSLFFLQKGLVALVSQLTWVMPSWQSPAPGDPVTNGKPICSMSQVSRGGIVTHITMAKASLWSWSQQMLSRFIAKSRFLKILL